jgi:hypothetical protein
MWVLFILRKLGWKRELQIEFTYEWEIEWKIFMQKYWDFVGRKWNYSQRFPWPWWWKNTFAL